MSAWNCPSCGTGTNRLIYMVGNNIRFNPPKCPACYDQPSEMRPVYLHQRMEGATSRNLTVAKAGIIDNRVISREDNMTVLDKRTGKETQY